MEYRKRVDIARDPKYRKELLREAVECLLAGDLNTGKALLRDYINATIGFEELSDLTHTPTKSLMRMLGPKGNPQARNLFDVIAPSANRRCAFRTLTQSVTDIEEVGRPSWAVLG